MIWRKHLYGTCLSTLILVGLCVGGSSYASASRTLESVSPDANSTDAKSQTHLSDAAILAHSGGWIAMYGYIYGYKPQIPLIQPMVRRVMLFQTSSEAVSLSS